jgi:hypothetical protein
MTAIPAIGGMNRRWQIDADDALQLDCNNRRVELQYDGAVSSAGERAMGDGSKKKFDLGRSGTVTCHVSEDAKRVRIELDVEKEGLSKTGLNGLIDALKKIREKMVR